MATELPVRACRIGNSTVAIAMARARQPGQFSVSIGGIEASRSFETEIGDVLLAFAKFPQLESGSGQLTLHLGDAESAIDSGSSLAELLKAFGASSERLREALLLIAGTVSKLFGLQRDPVLTQALIEAARLLPRAGMRLFGVEGYCEAVIRCGGDVKFGKDSLVIAFEGHGGSAQRVELALGDSRILTPARLARVTSRHPLTATSGILLLGAGQAAWFDVAMETQPTAAAFSAAFARGMPELIAMLIPARPGPLGLALIAASAQEKAVRLPALSATSGFHLAIESLEVFADGLFAAGWMHDPDGEFRDAEVFDFTLRNSKLSAQWRTYEGRAEIDGEAVAVTGFCAFLKRQRTDGFPNSPAVAVTLASGERLLCRGVPAVGGVRQRDAIASAIHLHGLEAGALDAYRPAFEAVSKRLFGNPPPARTLGFGLRSLRECSIIIPLYGTLRFLRSQILGLAGDPYIKASAEIIYVLDDPRLAGEAEHRIASLAHVTGLDIKLMILGANAGYGRANNAGAGAAEGKVLVLMNSDVVPRDSGWLLRLSACLDFLPPHSIAGPKLLYADDTLQHAGMYFYKLRNGAYQNMHYYKGYGREFPPANAAREVPAVTGALMVLAKKSFTAVGGFTTDYVIGDYEDSDLCLKLRAKGGSCHYLPSAELYHFERQSMSEAADARGEGATAYNRQLHHETWRESIGTLMNRAEFWDGAHVY